MNHTPKKLLLHLPNVLLPVDTGAKRKFLGTLKYFRERKYFSVVDVFARNDFRQNIWTSEQQEEVLNQACIGLAVADKLSGPYQVLPPVAGPIISGIDIEEWHFSEMERPQRIYKNGKYYLFFSCGPWELNPAWAKKFGNYRFKESSLYWFVSDNITGPFKPVADIPIVKGSEKTGMYGVNFLPSADDPEELWAIGWHHRLITLQVLPLFKANFNSDLLEVANNKL